MRPRMQNGWIWTQTIGRRDHLSNLPFFYIEITKIECQLSVYQTNTATFLEKNNKILLNKFYKSKLKKKNTKNLLTKESFMPF